MNVLSIIHGEGVRSGLFHEVVAQAGHRLEEWSLGWRIPPPRPLDDYGAVLIFGGAMHADQEEQHPWLRDENEFIQRLLESGTPLLGVCLGAQLIAKAAGASVHLANEAEIGWVDVELTSVGAADPVLGRFPESFRAFQWHYYTYDVPEGAEELACGRVCTQAFRLRNRVWGVQFHPEVRAHQIAEWVSQREAGEPVPEGVFEETELRIDEWNRLGRELCLAFLEVAEREPAGV